MSAEAAWFGVGFVLTGGGAIALGIACAVGRWIDRTLADRTDEEIW